MAKRILSLLIAALLVFGLVPAAALAKISVPAPAGGSALDEALNVSGGSLGFTSEGDYPWQVITEDDRIYAQSGNEGVSSSESVLTMTCTVQSNMAIHFDYKARGEGTSNAWDKCIFMIDSNQVFAYGQVSDEWLEYTVNVAAGEHTFTWKYTKDSSVNAVGDYFALDNVRFEEREALPVNEELDAAVNAEGGSLHFYTTGEYPWTVVTDSDTGRVCGMSGNGGVNSSVSEMTTAVTLEAGGTITFDYMAWGEGTGGEVGLRSIWDHCRFYVDGTAVFDVGALDNEWTTFTYELTAGEHELKWSYQKDSSTHPEGDYFKVDNVAITEGAAENMITEVAINGFVVPEWGASPFYGVTVPEGAHYSIQMNVWTLFDSPNSTNTDMVEGDVYDHPGPDFNYYQRFMLVPDEGYAFPIPEFEAPRTGSAEELTVLINGSEELVGFYMVDYDESSETYGCLYIASASFTVEEPEPQLITEINVDGFPTEITAGTTVEEALANLAVPTGANYSIAVASALGGSLSTLASDYAFEAGNEYLFIAIVAPNEGYTIADDAALTANGGEISTVPEFTVVTDEGVASIAIALLCAEDPASNVITTIEIEGFTAPVYGEHPDCVLTVPEGANYSVTFNNWNWFLDGFGNTVPPEGTFDNGDYFYFQYFEVTAFEGYTFADDVIVTINGDASLVDSNGENGSADSRWINSIFFTVTAPEPNYITSVELNDFTVPAWGEHPDFDMSIPEGAHYSIDYVDWSFYGDGFGILTADDVFDNTAATYAMYIQLIPEEGWVLADDAVFTINGETALVDPMGCGYHGGSYPYIYVNTVGFTVEEPPAEPIAITEINVEGFVIPTAGMTGAEYIALTVPAGANYHIELINAFNQTTGNPLVNEDVLEAGSAYIVGARVSPNEGYYFAEDATLLANGGTELLNSEHSHIVDSENAWIVMIECTIPTEQEPVIIDTVYVNGFEIPPIAGENPLDHLNLVIPDGEPYTLDMSAWYNEDSFFLQTDAFEAGGHYSVAFQLIPNEGYAFAEEVTIILDGGDVGVSEYVYNYTDHLLVYTIPYECVPATSAILGDVDLNGVVEVNDAILTLRYAMGLMDLTEEQLAQADVDGDGDYDLVDATLILRYAMDLIDHFPVEDMPIED